jgi:tRNA G18 (ribose-2'-O)-methylase SpoU
MTSQLVRIDDPADPAIAGYRNLKDRDLKALSGEEAHHGCFILEGLTVIEKALAASLHPILSLLISDTRVERVMPLVEAHHFTGPIYIAGTAVLDAIAGFPMHRGILGLGARPASVPAEALISAKQNEMIAARFLVLSGIANHDNMGGLFRNAAAFGVDTVLLDQACCDPFYRKAIRVSVGSTLLVPFARQERTLEIIEMLQTHNVRCLALATEGSIDLSDIVMESGLPTALVAGAEGSGLESDVVLRCEPVRIPMAKGFDSLNVATATGIALHWLFHNR